jgi:DNA-binding MarR family transcriptional regulator
MTVIKSAKPHQDGVSEVSGAAERFEPLLLAQSAHGIIPIAVVAQLLRENCDQSLLAQVIDVAEEQIRFNLVRSLRGDDLDGLVEDAQNLASILSKTTFPEDLDARWTELLAMWNTGAQMRDEFAVDAILGANNGKNRALLAYLGRYGETPRRTLSAIADLSDSHLSHVLAQLAKADLIEKRKHGNSKSISITPLGIRALRSTAAKLTEAPPQYKRVPVEATHKVSLTMHLIQTPKAA